MVGGLRISRSQAFLVLMVGVIACAPTRQQGPRVVKTMYVDTSHTTLLLAGEELFINRGCSGCHTIGEAEMAGPDLLGLEKRRSEEWIRNFITNPKRMLLTDDTAKAMLQEYKNAWMPQTKLNEREIDALIVFITTESKRVAAQRGS